jgi:hypothetical protein
VRVETRAEPVTRDSHFVETCRYIVLNPVRAGLCVDPGEWPWSSYRIHAGVEEPPAFMERLPPTFDTHVSYRRSSKPESRDCNLLEKQVAADRGSRCATA